MLIIYEELLESVRQRIFDSLTGSCISCLLELDDSEEHSCEPNCLNILCHFPLCFNRIGCIKTEKYRFKVLGALLTVWTGDRRLTRHHLNSYMRTNRHIFRDHKENYIPFLKISATYSSFFLNLTLTSTQTNSGKSNI